MKYDRKDCDCDCFTYVLYQVFDMEAYPFVTFDPIKTWKYGETQEFHYTVRKGIEPDTSPWDWIGLYRV